MSCDEIEGDKAFVSLASVEEETDGLHYVRQQESMVRYGVVEASRKTPAECFCGAVPDLHHRYTN